MAAAIDDLEAYTLMAPCGYQDGSCGYCKDPDSSQRTPRSRGAIFATSKRMTVDHYQKLVHRGWRRSGRTLYKPDQLRSCCPHYTIRLPAAELRTSRDQRQTLHRWNRYVLGEDYIREAAKLHPKTKSEKKQDQNAFDLLSTVHASEFVNVKSPPEPEHHFEVTIESNDFTEEKYELFEQYQRLVHKEPPSAISKRGFRQFLCDSPLIPVDVERGDGTTRSLGSFHQCYWLDGKLIALGVIDLLPCAVSAVYLIYDLNYEKWSFGKLSALREAALALEGGFSYYNMGFYIHSCSKMRYKCDYKPQYLLDPDTYEWNLLDETLKTKLDARKFVSPSRDRALANRDASANSGSGIHENASSNEATEHSGDTPHVREKYSTPSEAVNSKEALISFGMPGIMSREQVNAEFDENVPLIKVPQAIVPATSLVAWGDGPVTEESEFIKQVIADLVACIGTEVGRETIIDFS